ncbi:MAG: CHRD domain-containing protein, partial [Bacteroidetes bacterium]|nr:CHRD domain-containing protein [Bacteroidota bacterium]
VAQGDIGQNALTGESVQYTLNSATDPAINGTATFAERSNGTTLVTIALVGTTNGNEHLAHIHMNSATEGGGIVISLNVVDGGTGMSKTSVKELDDMTEISYDEMINFDGYINVHNSESDLGTLIAQGDIGSNG